MDPIFSATGPYIINIWRPYIWSRRPYTFSPRTVYFHASGPNIFSLDRTVYFTVDPISLFRQFSLWQWSFQSGRTNSNANDINPSWLSEIYFWFSSSYHIDHIKWKLLSKTQIKLFMTALFSTIWLILTQKYSNELL